jgi:hypothetical protein
VANNRYFSSGGGKQSIAALVLSARGEIDYPIHLFSNVGDDSEYPGTLEYVRNIAMPYAKAHGIQFIELTKRPNGKPTTLYGLLNRPHSRSIDIPMWLRKPNSKTGAPGRRGCTKQFKVKRIAAWTKKWGASAEQPATLGIGISLDEWKRVRTSGIAWQVNDYPLIDLRLTRADCVKIIEDAGLPIPPKSACWFCPFHHVSDWIELSQFHPVLFSRAIELETLLNERRSALGKDEIFMLDTLERLDVALSTKQVDMFTEDRDLPCDSGHCWT